MAMIIDISTKQPAKVDTSGAEAQPPNAAPDRQVVTVERRAFDACQHRSMRIDDVQRTVRCGNEDCGIWLDPVWCLQQLFQYYETRVDDRLAIITDWEKKQREKTERADSRKRKPRAARLNQLHQELERAAYNEYQARLLSLRALRQRARAEKLADDLDVEVDAPATSIADNMRSRLEVRKDQR